MLPHVFVDRSLGAFVVPRLLREGGITLTTMREHYGEDVGQRVDDVEWLIEIAEQGWIGFCKDSAIRRNEAERRVVVEREARLFVIANANISAADAARSFLDNLPAITAATSDPGPFIYSVQQSRIVRLLPPR